MTTGSAHKASIERGLYLEKSPSSQTIKVVSEADPNPEKPIDTINGYGSHIKVNIVNPGKMFVVFSNTSDDTRSLGITKDGEHISRFYFKTNYKSVISDKTYDRKKPTYEISSGENNKNKLIAAIVDIKEAGFYNIASTGSGLNIHYLAVEGVEDGDTNTGEVLGDGDGVSAVDFIYDGVSITQEKINDVAAFNFVVGNVFYQKSGTSIYFTNTSGIITLFFDRKSALSFIVKYNGIKPTASYLSKVTIEETTDTVIT